jgi:hypothetical protein
MDVTVWFNPATGEYKFYVPGQEPPHSDEEIWEQHGQANLSMLHPPQSPSPSK